ncbi:PAS domain S-box protein [Flavihumibacter sp. R14]|nr:PAS domain S-box protein [Flavihumibacter soli]
MNKCRVLIIEPNTDNIFAVRKYLLTSEYEDHEILFCSNLKQAVGIRDLHPECILCGLTLQDLPGASTIQQVLKRYPYVPVIVLTDPITISGAIVAIEMGAEDYLVNGRFSQEDLLKAIRLPRIRKRHSNNYRRLFDESPLPMFVYDEMNFEILDVNEAALAQYGYSREQFLAMNARQLRPEDEMERFINLNRDVPDTFFDFGQWKHLRKNGEIFFVHIYAHSTEFEGTKARIVLAADVDQKVKAGKDY